MSYLATLKNNNADKLWCGKGSTYDCLLALLNAIEKENYSDAFPESENLYNFLVFVENDNSNRFFNRLKELSAPPNTGRIPLDDAKSSLLVKLLVNRLDNVCIEYFHSNKSSEWVARNSYGEKLLKFWNMFNTEYIKEVMEFLKTHKPSYKPQEKQNEEKDNQGLETPEIKLQRYKSMASKLQGAWAGKLNGKIEKLEEEVTQKKQFIEKVIEVAKEVVKEKEKDKAESKKIVVKREMKNTKKYNKTQKPEDDGQGGWTKVTSKKKKTSK